MILNYFKTVNRNLLRPRGYAFITISELAISKALCLLLFTAVSTRVAMVNLVKQLRIE